jgi:DNA polymerase-3 subunit epsilon
MTMRVLLFDTETTGLIDNTAVPLDQQPHIIEFFGLSCIQEGDELREVSHWQSLFKHAKRLHPKITSITGITDLDLASAPFFKSMAAELAEYIARHDRVVAHNLSFDMEMVDNEYRRINGHVNWPPDRLCTVEATEHLKGHRMSLTDIHTFLTGAPFEKAHRAETDVRAMFTVYNCLLKRGDL